MVHRLQKELMKWLQTYETRQLVLAGDVGAAPCSYIRYSRSCGNPNEMHHIWLSFLKSGESNSWRCSLSPSRRCRGGNVSFGQRPLLAGASLPTRPEMPPTSCHCCCSGDTSLVGMPYSLILFVTRKSSMLTIGVLPAVRGTAHGASKPKRPFNPPGRSLRLDRGGPLGL